MEKMDYKNTLNYIIKNKSLFFKELNHGDLYSKYFMKLNHKNLIFKKKGDMGRIGVFGGSIEYTGAPYYSAISAIKSGCDLAHVFCHKDACIPIKSYSPELIVHPSFDDSLNQDLLNRTKRWFKSMDVLICGCGLGREYPTKEVFREFLIESSSYKDLIHVMDADSLWHLMEMEDLHDINFKNSRFILTPNIVEFQRIYDKFFVDENVFDYDTNQHELFSELTKEKLNKGLINGDGDLLIINNLFSHEYVDENLKIKDFFEKIFFREIMVSRKFNSIIVKKGMVDIITNGKDVILVTNIGSFKRCGGIGDILSGIICANLAGFKKNNYREINNQSEDLDQSKYMEKKDIDLSFMELCAMACFLCRDAAKNTYQVKGRSLTALDIINKLHEEFLKYDL